MSQPLISVCIATIRPQWLDTVVDSIRRQTYQDWELLLVGQGDDPDLEAYGDSVRDTDSRIRYLHSRRMGLSVARNLGIDHARGDIIAMTDDDCEAREDWLETIAARLTSDVMLVGGLVQKPPRPRHLFASCPAFRPAEAVYRPGPEASPPPGWDWMGANFAFRREVFDVVGPFDAHLGAGATFPAAEDTDFKLRVERLRLAMASTPESVVVHRHGYRYGLKSLLRSARNYAYGNGALAAKLTLQGDPRGEAWLERTRKQCAVTPKRPHRIPANRLRLRHFEEAYQRCLRDFQIDAAGHVLAPKAPVYSSPTGSSR